MINKLSKTIKFAEPSSCLPGWRRFNGLSCLQVHTLRQKTWNDARLECYNRGGRLAVFKHGIKLQEFSEFIDDYLDEWRRFHVGARYTISNGRWITVKNETFSLNKFQSLWGPFEPSGDGWCADMIFGEKWDNKWKGKGWRINDEVCSSKIGFICEKQNLVSGKDDHRPGH